jgi:hypothetical protein
MMIDVPTLPASVTSGEVPAICIAYAAAAFEVPPPLIITILKSEGGRVGVEGRNSNGTFDIGPGRINSIWLPVLHLHGIERAAVRDDGCLNVWVTTWILRLGINSANSYWRGVGRYHSSTMRAGRDLNGDYAARAWRYYRKLEQLELSWWGIPEIEAVKLTVPTPFVPHLLVAESMRSSP